MCAPLSKPETPSTLDLSSIHILKTSKLAVYVGEKEYEYEFRSSEKAHKAYRTILEQTLQGELPG